MNFVIQVYGSRAVANELRKAAAQAPKEMQAVAYRWAQGVRAKLKSTPYPPKRPEQRYVRTGRLASSWAVEKYGQKGVRIVNRVKDRRSGRPYAVYVVGDKRGERQAWMHRERWWLARKVVEEQRLELTEATRQELMRLFPTLRMR